MSKPPALMSTLVLTALALIAISDPSYAAVVAQEEQGFWACLACAVGAGFLISGVGLGGLWAFFGSGQGAVLIGVCYLECKELYDEWLRSNPA